MKYAFAALSLASAALAAEQIVGGTEGRIEDFPYQITLLSSGRFICGGSILDETHVVTAAHCTDGASARSLSIRAGSNFASSGGTVVQVAQIHQNPSYNPSTTDNDISVLELAEPLTFGSGVAAIDLASSDPSAGTIATVSGFGATSEGGASSSRLLYVDVPIVSNSECASLYSGFNEITDAMICAGEDNGGEDACQGDSGGPLVANGELVGVVSWGNGCARPGYPGVYSSVAYLRDFVESVL
ncbi:trypsin-like cysteine/serine peptidase domain-containing protein [Aspergillus karnatakaensis]|uniref:serine protease n=1 Tax=Aspergillus karnatakaensis TaxID=1810916 RepID=UPI003CCCE602